MCKNGRGKENEIKLKQNKVYGSKGRQSKGRRYFRTSESRENSKNQETQILRNHINEDGNLKGHIEEKTKVWDNN